MTEKTTALNQPRAAAGGGLSKLFLCAVACVVLAELVGSLTIPLGGKLHIVLMPLLWALLIGAVWGIASPRLPEMVQIDRQMQLLSAAVLQPALLIFIAKLGLLVGGNLPTILQSGWALAFQEFGHFFGTMLCGLPLALLLGIKREAIGATFSVGREPSLAIIGEKFGMDSPEGHGVLAEYITGTIFGTVFIAVFAGLVASLGVFNPLALAMGAGVGSGSMMAAASAAISAQETPEVAKQVAAFAAAANLVTVTIGTYFTLFLSLPFTIWLYRKLEPVLGRKSIIKDLTLNQDIQLETAEGVPTFRPLQLAAVWLITGLMALFGNWYNYKAIPDGEVLAGMAIIMAVVAVGFAIYRATRNALPAVLFVSLVAMALTYPGIPYANVVNAWTGKINFLSLATPVITYAGLSIAKDVPVFRQLGWRIVIVSLVANAGTFLGAALVAQFFVHPHM